MKRGGADTSRTYKTRYGVDWPVEMPDPLIGMTIGKKWRQYQDIGVEFADPWVPLIDAAKALIPEQYFKVPPWTEEHFHDWVMAKMGAITWGCASCGKSNDYGLLMLLDWMTDPYDTVIRLGSTDKQSLKSRSWNAVVTYFAALKRNKLGLIIPGKHAKSGYAILNDDADDSPESVGEKAGIVGVAVNDSEDSGKLQGAHGRYVRLVIDELATITHHENIKKAMSNLRVGATDFRFFALANPASWEDESCQYCIPPGGISSVNVDTGFWESTRGYLVRHHDGLKCITVTDPSKAAEFPFLITKDVIDANLADCDGNADAPVYWQMVRGFPVPSATGIATVLDAKVAAMHHAMDRVEFNPDSVVAVAAGIDPAWTEGGDGAIRARCYVRMDMYGKLFLDFTDGLSRLHIHASDPRPPVQQMREQTIELMRRPYEARFHDTAVDASANQGLADDLTIYAGADCLAVNNSVRASESPLRVNDPRPAKETIYDRGTESWAVLAEFIRAGMVRGLPASVVKALTTRRYMVRQGRGGTSTTVMFPLRMESKDEFKKRFKKSPDECDACALAALAVKERIGLPPFGFLVAAPPPESLTKATSVPSGLTVVQDESYGQGIESSDDMGGAWN